MNRKLKIKKANTYISNERSAKSCESKEKCIRKCEYTYIHMSIMLGNKAEIFTCKYLIAKRVIQNIQNNKK